MYNLTIALLLGALLTAGFLASANGENRSGKGMGHSSEMREVFADLSEGQRSELMEAKKNHDLERVGELLETYGVEMPEILQQHIDAQSALEAGDYEAFVTTLPEDSPLTEVITAENFDRFVEMHEAKQSGDLETAKEIANELGMKQFGRGHKKLGNKFSKEQHEAVKEAIENGDYNAWLEIVGKESPMTEKITAENFSLLQQMHTAKQDGDFETAQEIMDELGLEHKGRGRHGFGRGMNRGS